MRSWNDRVGIKAGDFTLFRLGKGAFYHLRGGVKVGRSSFVVGPHCLLGHHFSPIGGSIVLPTTQGLPAQSFQLSSSQALTRPFRGRPDAMGLANQPGGALYLSPALGLARWPKPNPLPDRTFVMRVVKVEI